LYDPGDRGIEIDGHEAVIRINYAPIARFEKHVGSRTTYDLVNKENAGKLIKVWRCRLKAVLQAPVFRA
jgi:hypothetical protein